MGCGGARCLLRGRGAAVLPWGGLLRRLPAGAGAGRAGPGQYCLTAPPGAGRRAGAPNQTAEAQALGVTSVPFFAIGNQGLAGAQPMNVFRDFISSQGGS